MMRSRPLPVALLLLVVGWSVCPLLHGADDATDPARPREPENARPQKKPRFTIGKETTYVTGPVDKDGFIDYTAALNEHLRKGVTPENNAVVLLWQAMGPRAARAMPDGYFRLLGVERPDRGKGWIDAVAFLKEDPDRMSFQRPGASEALVARRDQLLRTRRPWQRRDCPWMALWLDANEKPLTLVVRATECAHYYWPMVAPDGNGTGPAGLIDVPLPAVLPWREFGNALAARAMLRLADGWTNAAWHDLLACHRLGRLIGQGPALTDAMVGYAIDGVASQADLAFLLAARLDAATVRACLRDLQSLPPLAPFADKVDRYERFKCLDTCTILQRGTVPRTHTGTRPGVREKPVSLAEQLAMAIGLRATAIMNWEPAMRYANQWCDRMTAALRVEDRRTRMEKLADIERELKKLAEASSNGAMPLLSPDRDRLMGEKFLHPSLARLAPWLAKVAAVADQGRQTEANLHLAFALAAYCGDHGRYPATVEALAPKYLAAIPKDAYTGKPLIYRLTTYGYLLYSVGPNGQDDGGHGRGDRPPGDDIGVRMPLPGRAGR